MEKIDMRLRTSAAAALLAAGLGAVAAATPARAGGELRCSVAGGIGLVIVGKRATTCVYYRHDGQVEFYIGSFTRVGLDVGPAAARQAYYDVLGSDLEPVGALDGDFGGLSAGTSLGRGGAADALIGGRGAAAQIVPAYNSRQPGYNLAFGIGHLHLRYAGTEPRKPRFRGTGPEDFNF